MLALLSQFQGARTPVLCLRGGSQQNPADPADQSLGSALADQEVTGRVKSLADAMGEKYKKEYAMSLSEETATKGLASLIERDMQSNALRDREERHKYFGSEDSDKHSIRAERASVVERDMHADALSDRAERRKYFGSEAPEEQAAAKARAQVVENDLHSAALRDREERRSHGGCT